MPNWAPDSRYAGCCGFREREDAIDDGLQASCGDELHHRLELVFCAHVGAQKRQLATEEEAEVNFRIVAGSGAARYQAADGARLARLSSQVAVPTCSKTTSTPRFPVMRRTSSRIFWDL